MKSTTNTNANTVNTNTNKATRNTPKSFGYTAAEWKQVTYDAYLSYVAFMNGKIKPSMVLERLNPLFSKCGYTLNYTNLTAILTVRMASFGTDHGEIARKIKSITTFRDFLRGGYADVVTAPLHFNAGKAPKAPAPKKAPKAKAPTKKELLAQLEELKAQLAAIA